MTDRGSCLKGTRYIGEWFDDARQGRGIFFDETSDAYFEGVFQNNKTSVNTAKNAVTQKF